MNILGFSQKNRDDLLSSEYYCEECQRNHQSSSKIGKEHLRYKKIRIKRTKPRQNVKEVQSQNAIQLQSLVEETESVSDAFAVEGKEPRSNFIVNLIRDYQNSYRKGVESYGVWWKVFQLSIWSIILTFLLTASIIFIVFLPKIDFINLTIR